MTTGLDRHSARWLDALASRAATIMQVFDGAGFERVAPSHIQPAALLVDLVGEEMRERTFGVTDRSGRGTVPAHRSHGADLPALPRTAPASPGDRQVRLERHGVPPADRGRDT